MSKHRGAWNRRPEAGIAGRLLRGLRPEELRRAAGFTLVELLVAVAIIAIMSALLAPAVRGLLGVTGPRGGLNSLSAALEQARLSALESGVTAYLGLAVDSTAGHSAVIVFREAREDEGNRSIVPVTRWVKLPLGVYHKADGLENFAVPSGGALPKLGTSNITSVSVVPFDRFGRLKQSTSPKVIQLGAMTGPGGEFMGGANNYFEVTIQPLTGRANIVDKALEQ